MPMAIQFGTTVTFGPGGDRIRLLSATEAETANVCLEPGTDEERPWGWAAYVAGVLAEIGRRCIHFGGPEGHLTSRRSRADVKTYCWSVGDVVRARPRAAPVVRAQYVTKTTVKTGS